ncbi:MAG: hypothetical protein ACQES9_01805 [Myxococcota bacterium]
MKKLFSLFFITLLVFNFGCEDDVEDSPSRILERPTTMQFFCVDEDFGTTPVSAAECASDPDSYKKYALVLSTAKGELAVVDLDKKRILDLDENTPGYNLFPVNFPAVDLIIDSDREMVHVLNSSKAAITSFSLSELLKHIQGQENQLQLEKKLIHTSGGNIGTNPIDFLLLEEIGNFLVLFPRCDLIARVDEEGLIQQSWKTGDGTTLLVEAGSEPHCPQDPPFDSEAAPPFSQDFPLAGPVDMVRDGSSLFVGYQNVQDGTRVELLLDLTLDATGNVASSSEIETESGTDGWKRLRISPETKWGKFLYGITVKGDIRVIRLRDRVECDTNVDTLFLPSLDIEDELRGCVPNGLYPRNFLAQTPGIYLRRGLKAVDITFFEKEPEDEAEDLTDKSTFFGIFGIIISSDGMAFSLNIDENFSDELFNYRYGTELERTWPSEVLAHRIRNYTDLDNNNYDTSGRPRLDNVFTYFIDGSIHNLEEGQYSLVSKDGSWLVNIRDYLVQNEAWSLDYQANIAGSERAWGLIEDGSGVLKFSDAGGNFCELGVKSGDVIHFRGCIDDLDCPDFYVCGRTPLQSFDSNGLCFPEEHVDDFVNSCSRLLASDREYKISSVSQDSLELDINYLEETTIDGTSQLKNCSKDSECWNLGVYKSGICFKDEGYCASAPHPAKDARWCYNGLQNYEIRIDDQFMLEGSVTQFQSPFTTDSNGNCVVKDGTPFDYRISVEPGLKETPFFDFWLEGDETRSIPFRYEIVFAINGGFNQFRGDLGIRFPACAATGPDGNVYITDQGDTGSNGRIIGQMVKLVTKYFSMDLDFIVR